MKPSRPRYRTSLATFISALLLAVSADATTLTVTSTADGGGTCPGASCTLRQAIATAAFGDTINFSLPANSMITLTSQTELVINKNLTISGPGANLLTVQRSTAGGTLFFRIFNINGNFNVTISGLTIANGHRNPGDGGGISNAGTLTITNSTISGNFANVNGGGIFNSGTLTITNSTISGNSANTNDGGGIFNSGGALTITDSTISGNSAVASIGQGGGISTIGGTVTIADSILSGNTANDDGGGIFNIGGALTVTNSTISGNNCLANDGGGILNSGTLTIKKSTISGNSVGGDGGGIYNTGQCTITSSTISLNTASISGGGIYFGGGMVTLKNTIIALNTAGGAPDFSGTLTSEGYNLIGNTSGMTTLNCSNCTGNQYNVNPMLGPLQDNGGPTFTHALLSGSTAIEGGHSFGSNNDQRRLARPVDDPGIPNAFGGDGSDIGAYEVQADQLPGCSNLNRIVNNNNDGATGSLRFVIAEVCAGSTITFAPNVTGAINLTSGQLLLNKTLTINGPGANLLTIQRDPAFGFFRIFNITPATVIANIAGLTIANGNVAGNGGGISNAGTLTITNSTISGNSAGSDVFGGGIFNSAGTVTITNSTISGNSALGTNGQGGGIYNSNGTVTIANSTVSGNSAQIAGGINNLSSAVIISNSTISGNTSSSAGGIYNELGTVDITSSTISINSASTGFGGGIYNASGSVRARNTIIALNTAPNGPDVYNPLISEGYNLIGNTMGTSISGDTTGNQYNVNPMLGPLQNNGGPTFTRALLPGSPAIDKGHSSGSTTDQRGFIRPVDNPALPNATEGDGGDIGAFEVSVNISGTISYCSNPVPGPVPNVTLTLTGTTSGSTLSDGSGNYSLLGLVSGGTYTVTPTKAARVPGSANINTVDVIATQRHFLNLGTPLAGCRLMAANVNGDGSVNTVDVIATQRFFLGLLTGIANTGKYQFTPANRSYSGIVTDQTAQNYDTLVFGDTASSFVELVDSPEPTAADDGTSADQVRATVAAVALPNVAVDAFVTNFIIPVTTTTINAGDKLVGFQGDFTFDETVVTFQSEPVQKAGITGGNWNVSGNVLLGTGPIRTLRVSAYSNGFTALNGSGTLFELRMTRMSQVAQSTQLLWANPPDHFIFIDADLKTQKPGKAAPGSVTSSEKRR